MSQIYEWVNYDKRERLDGYVLGGSGKLWESSWTGCVYNNALLTLLADLWKGDHLVWYGCEGLGDLRANTPFKKQLLYSNFENDYYEYADITGRFREAEGQEGYDLQTSSEFIYQGPSDLEARWYRYVVNLDKKEFIDREHTAVRSVIYREVWRDDLFPVLSAPWDAESGYIGTWFGDILAAVNERPPADFKDLSYLKSSRSVSTTLTNEEILTFVSEGAPKPPEASEDRSLWRIAWHKYADQRLWELIGTDTSGEIL